MMQPVPVRNKREVHGILLVNKNLGPSSNQILQQVKRLYSAKKAGHTGSLDPLATGMLPLCFGEATKFSQYLLEADKVYQVTGLLGIKTTTGDTAGEILSENTRFQVSEASLCCCLEEFKGLIHQVPSMFSALKHQGQPLYKLARKGLVIDRPPRPVWIRKLELNEFDGKRFRLTVWCSKGTYIRNLVEDMGDRLGVGAHVLQLHRLYTAGFIDKPMYSVEELALSSPEVLDQRLEPIDSGLMAFPALLIRSDVFHFLKNGRSWPLANLIFPEGTYRLYLSDRDEVISSGFIDDDAKRFFLGLGDVSSEQLKAKRICQYSE